MGSMDTDPPKLTQLVMRVWAFTESAVSGDTVPNIAKDNKHTHLSLVSCDLKKAKQCFDIVSTG